MKGWVYIITNRAMPGLVKIGYTSKNPRLRATELSGTGVPHPFDVDYEILVEQPYLIEQKAHEQLADRREGKEWFRVSVYEAVATLRSVAEHNIQVENFIRADKQKILAEEQRIKNQRAREAEQRRQQLLLHAREKFKRPESDQKLREIAKEVVEKCSHKSGLIFKSTRIDTSLVTAAELINLYRFICVDNRIDCILDIDYDSVADPILRGLYFWWDSSWRRNEWIIEGYKKIARGEVDQMYLREFVSLISGCGVADSVRRFRWHKEFEHGRDALAFLKANDRRFSNV